MTHIPPPLPTHTQPQRVDQANKEVKARQLAMEMLKEQLKIPDIDSASGLSKKEKLGYNTFQKTPTSGLRLHL